MNKCCCWKGTYFLRLTNTQLSPAEAGCFGSQGMMEFSDRKDLLGPTQSPRVRPRIMFIQICRFCCMTLVSPQGSPHYCSLSSPSGWVEGFNVREHRPIMLSASQLLEPQPRHLIRCQDLIICVPPPALLGRSTDRRCTSEVLRTDTIMAPLSCT